MYCAALHCSQVVTYEEREYADSLFNQQQGGGDAGGAGGGAVGLKPQQVAIRMTNLDFASLANAAQYAAYGQFPGGVVVLAVVLSVPVMMWRLYATYRSAHILAVCHLAV